MEREDVWGDVTKDGAIRTGSKTGILDIVKVLRDGLPSAAAERLLPWVAGVEVRARRKSKTVGNYPGRVLVNISVDRVRKQRTDRSSVFSTPPR